MHTYTHIKQGGGGNMWPACHLDFHNGTDRKNEDMYFGII